VRLYKCIRYMHMHRYIQNSVHREQIVLCIDKQARAGHVSYMIASYICMLQRMDGWEQQMCTCGSVNAYICTNTDVMHACMYDAILARPELMCARHAHDSKGKKYSFFYVYGENM
jgi:hypothetical protein